MDIVGLLSDASNLPLAQAAACYAAAGVPVFPCVPGEKRPLTVHGFHDASTDPRTVHAWWVRSPRANIGIPTGRMSGVEVVDIDRRPHASGFSSFERARRAGITAGWAALVRTPSGGIHAYYPADGDRPQRSWQAPGVHIDFRGDGGYILAPPSTVGGSLHPGGYALMAIAKEPTATIDAGTLHSFLEPLPPARIPPHQLQPLNVEGLAKWLAARGEGERNRALFWAACRAAENSIPLEQIQASLSPAAQQAGLTPREIAITIRSALRMTGARATPTAPTGSGREHRTPRPKQSDNTAPHL